MRLLIIGDVHGCSHTFKKLVEEHWIPEEEFLIQVGDLISKGPHSGSAVKYALKLQEEYPYSTHFLMGNHEHYALKYAGSPGRNKIVDQTMASIQKSKLDSKRVIQWINQRPMKWENPYVLITHAGVALNCRTPFAPTNPRGVLFNRSDLELLPKVQVLGHKVINGDKPLFKTSENSWNLDTGAWLGRHLSAIKLTYQGKYVKSISVPTHPKDLR